MLFTQSVVKYFANLHRWDFHKKDAVFSLETPVVHVYLQVHVWVYKYTQDMHIFTYITYSMSVYSMCNERGTMAVAILPLLPTACWYEPRQSGTNNTWRAVQRQLGSVVRAGPINEWECGRGRGRGTVPAYATAWEPMHSDRSSPSPVLAWYKLIPACAHVVLQQQQCRTM